MSQIHSQKFRIFKITLSVALCTDIYSRSLYNWFEVAVNVDLKQ